MADGGGGPLVWPHLARWLAERKTASAHAERFNVLADALWGGVAAAALSMRLWPVAAICVVGFINCLLFGGPVFLLIALAVFVTGVLGGTAWFGLAFHLDTEPLPTALAIVTILSYVILIGTTAYRLRLRQRATRAALEHEERKSHELLTNVFPESIVPRLRGGESPIADQFADVTVVFIDIVDFTPLAERIGPRRTVLLLNDLFGRFDQAARGCGVEKIETTGDGYLAVAGAPAPLEAHVEAGARFALAALSAVKEGVAAVEAVHVRIGLHAGPVYAGVIGDSRFHYKLFGDTVNVASRVQGHAQPGRALASEAVFRRLRHAFRLEEHGTVDLKGHGPMRTYWLVGRL